MSVAITGGSGFIGKHLIPKLISKGYSVRAASRKSRHSSEAALQYFPLDLTNTTDAELRDFLCGCDILLHLAGEIIDETRMRGLHVEATQRLADAASSSELAHWVQLSSCGIYGPIKSGAVFEDAAKNPIGEYETTKWLSEEIARKWGERNGRTVTILRPSIIYAGDMPNDSLRALISSVRKNFFFFIGKSKSTYSCVHVKDVVDAVLRGMERNDQIVTPYNLSETVPLEQLIATIAELLGKQAPRRRVPEYVARWLASISTIVPLLPLTHSRVDALTTCADYRSDLARRQLGWNPRVSLQNGMTDLISVMHGKGAKP
jgi:nucleoside-diphosphate-sugar epimerase